MPIYFLIHIDSVANYGAIAAALRFNMRQAQGQPRRICIWAPLNARIEHFSAGLVNGWFSGRAVSPNAINCAARFLRARVGCGEAGFATHLLERTLDTAAVRDEQWGPHNIIYLSHGVSRLQCSLPESRECHPQGLPLTVTPSPVLHTLPLRHHPPRPTPCYPERPKSAPKHKSKNSSPHQSYTRYTTSYNQQPRASVVIRSILCHSSASYKLRCQHIPPVPSIDTVFVS